MKLYEYEGKRLFARAGIPIGKGVVTDGNSRIEWNGKAVVKAQLLEGGRGKRGLVKITDDPNSAIQELKKQGISKFLVEEFIPHEKEVYISIILNRDIQQPVITLSPEGGVDVEEAKEVKQFVIPLERGPRSFDIVAMEKYLKIKNLAPIVYGIYKIFTEYDAELVEINPLAVTKDQQIFALDAKVILDDNALYKHQDLLKEFQRDYAADNYVELDGDVGIIGNGAGLTMATMDLVKLAGGNPADFLDVGGGADKERVKESVIKVGSNPRVKKIVINIFGGITRCDEVALGIVEAYDVIKKPIFVRLVGTNEEEGWKILKSKGIKYYENPMNAIGDAVRS